MRELIVGADGFIGGALRAKLPGAVVTTRHKQGTGWYLDLLGDIDLPPCSVAYVCAGMNGAKTCEGSQDAFRVNVDAPIELARLLGERGGFMVWISSMSVEWFGAGAYQRQKLAAECVLRGMLHVGVVRAGRVMKGNVEDLCDTLIRVGRERVSGVTRWGSDEIAYQK